MFRNYEENSSKLSVAHDQNGRCDSYTRWGCGFGNYFLSTRSVSLLKKYFITRLINEKNITSGLSFMIKK